MFSKSEFEVLLKTMDNLSLYQILKVTPAASASEVRDSFHREALSFHPDRYQGLGDVALLNQSKKCYAKVVEAYRVLSNKTLREKYDLSVGGKVSSPTSQSQDSDIDDSITGVKFKKSIVPPAALKFFKLAQSAFQGGNLQAAKMNIQLALNTDPNNKEFMEFSERIAQGLKKTK